MHFSDIVWISYDFYNLVNFLKKSYTEGGRQRRAKKKCEEAMSRAAVGIALPYAEDVYMPRVVVGVAWATSRAPLRRRLTPRAGLAGVYADGPNV
jgi:hypothetical protein